MLGDDAVQAGVHAAHADAFRQVEDVFDAYAGFEFDVDDAVAAVVEHVDVRHEVRAVARGAVVEAQLVDEPGFGHGFEAVVDGGQRDAGKQRANRSASRL